jgi:hypothetical protein
MVARLAVHGHTGDSPIQLPVEDVRSGISEAASARRNVDEHLCQVNDPLESSVFHGNQFYHVHRMQEQLLKVTLEVKILTGRRAIRRPSKFDGHVDITLPGPEIAIPMD